MLTGSGLALSGAPRQLPQRGSHWQVGQKAVYFYNSVELIILLEKALSKGVFNYLHLSADSLYKSSIDKGPIYSIIDPTFKSECKMRKVTCLREILLRV